MDNNTFGTAKLPAGRKTISAKCIFTWRKNHLKDVVKALLQKEGVDFLETFSSTSVQSSILIIATSALYPNWVLNHWNIERAFVQSEIDRDIFLRSREVTFAAAIGHTPTLS